MQVLGQWDSGTLSAVVLLQDHGWGKWDSRTSWDIVTVGQRDSESTVRRQHEVLIVIL